MTASTAFVPLQPRDKAPATGVGCLLALASFLLFVGGGIVAVFVVAPAGEGDAWVMPVVGGAFALVGAVLLWGGIRGARGLALAPAQLFIERGAALVPGATVRVRLRQPGPVGLVSLELRACCARLYQRRVRRNSSATVEDQEPLWEQVLVSVRDQRVAAGDALEREVALTLPVDARPTGPAQPEGRIRWHLEVRVEAGFMRAAYRAFDVRVAAARPPAAAAVAPGQTA